MRHETTRQMMGSKTERREDEPIYSLKFCVVTAINLLQEKNVHNPEGVTMDLSQLDSMSGKEELPFLGKFEPITLAGLVAREEETEQEKNNSTSSLVETSIMTDKFKNHLMFMRIMQEGNLMKMRLVDELEKETEKNYMYDFQGIQKYTTYQNNKVVEGNFNSLNEHRIRFWDDNVTTNKWTEAVRKWKESDEETLVSDELGVSFKCLKVTEMLKTCTKKYGEQYGVRIIGAVLYKRCIHFLINQLHSIRRLKKWGILRTNKKNSDVDTGLSDIEFQSKTKEGKYLYKLKRFQVNENVSCGYDRDLTFQNAQLQLSRSMLLSPFNPEIPKIRTRKKRKQIKIHDISYIKAELTWFTRHNSFVNLSEFVKECLKDLKDDPAEPEKFEQGFNNGKYVAVELAGLSHCSFSVDAHQFQFDAFRKEHDKMLKNKKTYTLYQVMTFYSMAFEYVKYLNKEVEKDKDEDFSKEVNKFKSWLIEICIHYFTEALGHLASQFQRKAALNDYSHASVIKAGQEYLDCHGAAVKAAVIMAGQEYLDCHGAAVKAAVKMVGQCESLKLKCTTELLNDFKTLLSKFETSLSDGREASLFDDPWWLKEK